MKVRTRMAPSPTGEFHIGSMRTLLYNYAYARNKSGDFILRIEDTDRERFVEGALERTLGMIKAYGLDWDEGPEVGGPFAPYIQSERLEIYRKYAQELIDKGDAYYCFCTKDRLEKLREEQKAKGMSATKYDRHCLNLNKEEVENNLKNGKDYVIRLKIPDNKIIEYEDAILGKISFPSKDIDDQVLIKSDGFPTYQLAVVIDDHLMEITHVMRGVEWLASTPKHLILYEAFGWKPPIHAHVPLLKEIDSTKKLSKRMGSVAAADFLRDGYLPEALLNFLMFLGWNPGTEKEIYSLDEFIKDFSIEKIQTTDLVSFDRDKLSWYNGHYIRSFPTEVLYEKLLNWSTSWDVKLNGRDDKNKSLKILELVKERMKTLAEFNTLTGYFFEYPKVSKDLLTEFSGSVDKAKEILNNYLKFFDSVPGDKWIKEFLDLNCHDLLSKYEYNPKEAFMTLRIAVTGNKATPPLFDVLEILGKETVISRIKTCLKNL